MDIRYFQPLSAAYERMRRALFHPFDIRKWFLVGFTAFLAGLTDCHGKNGLSGNSFKGDANPEELLYFPQRIQEWFYDHPEWLMLIVVGAIVVVMIVIAVAWLGARGKFMFLDNVVQDRALVSKPWYEFRQEGNSLFLWSVLYGVVALLIFGAYLVYCYVAVVALYEACGDFSTVWLPLAGMILGLIALFALAKFITIMAVDFLVPIMYRSRVGLWAGLQMFLTLFWSHIFSFIGYTLFTFLVWIVIVLGIIGAVVLTCCIGGLFLIIPYINAVVLLPVSYTMRAFSLEFLGQFGVEYQLFPRMTPDGIQETVPQT